MPPPHALLQVLHALHLPTQSTRQVLDATHGGGGGALGALMVMRQKTSLCASWSVVQTHCALVLMPDWGPFLTLFQTPPPLYCSSSGQWVSGGSSDGGGSSSNGGDVRRTTWRPATWSRRS